MVTKRPTTTLLSKFTHLFRNSDNKNADSAQSPRADSQFQSITQRRQSKRRIDAIRGYELGQLRTIIRNKRNEQWRAQPGAAALATPLRSKGLANSVRSSILDNINEAEAYTDQWWGTDFSLAALTIKPSDRDKTASELAPVANLDELDLDFTDMQGLAEDEPTTRAPTSGPLAMTIDASTPVESALCDAALLYAQGEFEEAHGVLCALLADPSLGHDAAELLTVSLFDVYRCAGQQERFEALALDYASRIGRSPAEWFSLADECAESASLDPAQEEQPFWKCPPILDAQAMADFATHHAANTHVCAINWLPLQFIDAAAAPAFGELLADWCNNPVELRWLGIDCLCAALQMCRISGKVPDNEPWWLIQMDTLCLLQKPHAFEEVALDYCVAFEVSPPSWKTVAGKLVLADDVPDAKEDFAAQNSQSFDCDQPGKPNYVEYEFSGNITANNPKTLDGLFRASLTTSEITVTCSRLGRIDIHTAGRLITWAEQYQARGGAMKFIYMPRLVLVYFHMLGMQNLASLSAGPH